MFANRDPDISNANMSTTNMAVGPWNTTEQHIGGYDLGAKAAALGPRP